MVGYQRLLQKLPRQKPDQILRSQKRSKDSRETGRTSFQFGARLTILALSAGFGAAAILLYQSSL